MFHQDLLKCADSITSVVLDLNEKEYLNDKYLPLFLSRASLLEKLSLRNFRFPNKSSYVTFCSYFSQIKNLRDLSLTKFQFNSTLKTTFFHYLSQKVSLHSLSLVDCSIEIANLSNLVSIINQSTQLRNFELRNFIVPKAASLTEILGALASCKGLERVTVCDRKLKMTPDLAGAFSRLMHSRSHFCHFELVAASYEDIFDHFKEPLNIDTLLITTTQEFSQYAVNKLLFDLA